MSLLSDMLAALKAVGAEVVSVDEKAAALLFGAVKSAGKIAEKDVVAAIPGITAALKTFAVAEVKAIGSDPALINAVGSWKLGIACALVLQDAEKAFPMLVPLGKGLLQSTIETIVQDEVAAFTTSNPTSSPAKS